MDISASPSTTTPPEGRRLAQSFKGEPSLVPSHGITIEEHHEHPSELSKPPLLKHVSTPAFNSPLRHHRRTPSTPKQVKESLNARSEYVTSQDDGVAEHRINQYIIKQEIGRGSFGAVHLAVDQYGTEYAVKEFSKARLRKRAQSHILRKPFQQRRRGALQGFNSPLHRNAANDTETDGKPPLSIDLIKEEIAIMKKLNHPNLVSLIEVLDDPSEDSLYMVMEMCKKGVVMRVGLEERADPYPEDTCRYWFRDLILAIEYLHAQGIVHRDIKPDNCLITTEDVLKVVDFGVSEMFEKNSEMLTAKSAGSPAFLPPELCVARHGDISGKAADIWSMGVTLYCLKYGRIPFEKSGIFELYESIKDDQPDLNSETNQDFQDLMTKILEKDPSRRIKMAELREHAWVTKQGTDPLLPELENVSNMVEPPTEAEMNAAITGNMTNLLTVMKAVNKFKALLAKKRPPVMSSILGDHGDSRPFSHPPSAMNTANSNSPFPAERSRSDDRFDREKQEAALVSEGVHRDVQPDVDSQRNLVPPSLGQAEFGKPPRVLTGSSTESDDIYARATATGDDASALDPERLPPFMSQKKYAYSSDEAGHRGHAHDPLEDHLYLYIGPSTFSTPSGAGDRRASFVPDEDDVPIVSESPGAADVDIYETAYRDEIERILARAKEQEREPNVYLTRRVDERLLAISGLAGKWMAVGEEARNQFRDYTQFSARKAKVTEVSRALREAAREEYEKRRQERREQIAAAKAEKAKFREEAGEDSPQPAGQSTAPIPRRPPVEGGLSSRQSAVWKGKAVEKGRSARTQIKGFVDLVKSKRTQSRDELS